MCLVHGARLGARARVCLRRGGGGIGMYPRRRKQQNCWMRTPPAHDIVTNSDRNSSTWSWGGTSPPPPIVSVTDMPAGGMGMTQRTPPQWALHMPKKHLFCAAEEYPPGARLFICL